MKRNRQRPISVNTRQRDNLDSYKRRFDQSIKKKTEWGEFLGTVALLGLAAIGTYHLVKAMKRTTHSADIECAVCKKVFIMAVPEGSGTAVHTVCPDCRADLVIDLRSLGRT